MEGTNNLKIEKMALYNYDAIFLTCTQFNAFGSTHPLQQSWRLSGDYVQL